MTLVFGSFVVLVSDADTLCPVGVDNGICRDIVRHEAGEEPSADPALRLGLSFSVDLPRVAGHEEAVSTGTHCREHRRALSHTFVQTVDHDARLSSDPASLANDVNSHCGGLDTLPSAALRASGATMPGGALRARGRQPLKGTGAPGSGAATPIETF